MGDFLEEETLGLSVESSGLVGVSGRSTTCTSICWHQAALYVYRRAGGLVWLLWSTIQKQVGASVCPQGKGFLSSHGRYKGFWVIVAVELRLRTGWEWAGFHRVEREKGQKLC